MRVAAARLIGFHDFRNFCKIGQEEVAKEALHGNELFVSPFFKCVHSAEIVEKPTRFGLTVQFVFLPAGLRVYFKDIF